MKHRQRAIRMGVDPHGGLHIMEPVLIGRNLQMPALIAHRIVVGDDAVLLHTQHIGQTGSPPGHKRGAGFCSGDRKSLVLGRDESGTEQLIGRRHLRNPRQGQLFGQPILQSAKDTLRPAPGFWRIGRNQRDPQLL